MSRAGVWIEGQVFGDLTAIKRSDQKRGDVYLWVMSCPKGHEVLRTPTYLKGAVRRGVKPTCDICKSSNDYTVSGETVTIDISTKKHPNVFAKCDLADFDKVLDGRSKWIARLESNGKLYVYRKHQSQTMHRLLMGFPGDGKEVDHINGDSLDNRSKNLRVVTNYENRRNTKISSRNRTGVVGVMFKNNRYIATAVDRDGKQRHIGAYRTLEEAANARKQAEIKYGYHENHGRPA